MAHCGEEKPKRTFVIPSTSNVNMRVSAGACMKSNGAERSLAGDKLGERGSRRQTGTGSSQRRESQPEARPSIHLPSPPYSCRPT